MDKLDILIRKLCTQYDEYFSVEKIVPTVEEFNEMADQVRNQARYKYSDSEFISIREQVRELRSASIGIGISIDKPSANHDLEWFSHFSEINQNSNKYNQRFNLYMAQEKHWSDDMIKDLDRNTTEILNRLGDPKRLDSFKRKGLVIGDVQSGKTANYTSVCNKAVDAGYKIIIVLAGRTNTLRRQTQKRLESDFIGRQKNDANQQKGEILPTVVVGVGKYGDVGSNCVEAFTTNANDFSKKVADTTTISINEKMMPKLFVVKKVKSVLDNLAEWLGDVSQKTINVPMLLIDDEADDASVNTNGDGNPTAINACIRRILKLFSQSTYLAVTATPFANILINPFIGETNTIDKDLFPEDFIYCLPTPSNYIGSEKMFRNDSTSGIVIPIGEDDVKQSFPFKHKKNQDIVALPESLKKAIRFYAITNAVRDVLGYSRDHRSMMINVSRFVDVQNRLKGKVIDFWNDSILLYIKAYSKMGVLALEYYEIKEIKAVFDESSIGQDYSISWETVQSNLYSSNEHVDILSINQKSTDTLDYERYERENNREMRVIAIGGDCLSRGLTLEGLCVSYFYRNSQMYDTLMQMGRWFGYRSGYDKLIRVWMAEDAEAWYTHISETTEQLKLEVFRMNRNKLKPMEFGYKIRCHPDALVPTARAKMKNAKLEVSYAELDVSGHLVECPRLHDSVDIINQNTEEIKRFIKIVSEYGNVSQLENSGDVCIKKVSSKDIANLLRRFKTLDWNFYFDSATLADSIRNTDEKWNVFIKNGFESPPWTIDFFGGNMYKFGAQRRSSTRGNGVLKISGSKAKVGAGKCTAIGLEKYTYSEVERKWQSLPDDICKRDDGGYKDIPDNFILHNIEHPMLLIHYLKITNNNKENLIDENCKVIALGLGFPSKEDYKDGQSSKSERQLVKVYLNVIAQRLSEEEGDDVVYDDL